MSSDKKHLLQKSISTNTHTAWVTKSNWENYNVNIQQQFGNELPDIKR